MHCGNPKEREKSRENIWWNNGWKLPKFDERHEINIQKFQRPPNKMNSKTHTETSKLSKDKNKESWKQQERSDTIQGNFNLIIGRFLSETSFGARRPVLFKMLKQKQKQNCQARILDPEKLSFKVRKTLRHSEEKLRHSQINDSGWNLLLAQCLAHKRTL